MAEIILEPTVQSKVIPLSLRLNDTDTSLVSQLVTNRQFNTADTDAWFSFTLEGLAATTGTFDLTLINLHDKSVFNHTDKVFNTNPFYYKLDSGTDELTNEIRHEGKWVGQLVVTLANGDSATRKFIFGIEGHILDGTVVQTILLEDYNALISDIESAKDELTQYNIDYASLIGTVTEQEAARLEAEELRVIADALRETKEGVRQATFEANEVIRDGVVDSAIEGEMISQTVATKLAEKEATFAPRMLSLESELAETLSLVNVKAFGAKGNGLDDDYHAIQEAIDSVDKGTIYLPKGVYLISETIKINKDYVEIVGDGYRTTTISPYNDFNGDLVLLGNDLDRSVGNWRWGNSIKRMSIRGGKGIGLRIQNTHQWIVDNIELRENNQGIYGEWAWIGRVLNSYLYNNLGDGFHAGSNCHGLTFIGNHVIGNVNGVYAGNRMDISSNTFENNKENDIWIEKTAVTVATNYFEGGRKQGNIISIENASDIEVFSNGIGSSPTGIKIKNSKSISVRNNHTGLAYWNMLNYNYNSVIVEGNCQDIHIKQRGPVSIAKEALDNVIVGEATQHTNLNEGDITDLVEGVPTGWSVGLGDIQGEVIDSFGENNKAIRITNNIENHSYFQKKIEGLVPNKVYTFGALINYANVEDKTFFRLYIDLVNRPLENEYSTFPMIYDKGSLLATTSFKSREDGSALIGFGSATQGQVDLEWVTVVKGQFNEGNFPRKNRLINW